MSSKVSGKAEERFVRAAQIASSYLTMKKWERAEDKAALTFRGLGSILILRFCEEEFPCFHYEIDSLQDRFRLWRYTLRDQTGDSDRLQREGTDSNRLQFDRWLCGEEFEAGRPASMAFTREADSEKALRTVEDNGLLIAHRIKDPIRFVKAGAIQDAFFPELEEDPRKVPMDEKLELTRNYNSLPLAHEGVVTTITGYSEIIREKFSSIQRGRRSGRTW